MTQAERVDLARAPGFRLGRLTVRPATRELVRDDGEVEILEPRVMQVLVVLGQADGLVVSRDDLTLRCWDGRVVGDDAINRVISRLRRSADAIGEGAFQVETVTKVGYRLALRGAQPATVATMPATGYDRRTLIGGGALLGLTALAFPAAYMAGRGRGSDIASPQVAALMQQAELQLNQATPEGQDQAMALYQRVVAIAPDYADAWGRLGMSYARAAKYRPAGESIRLAARADAAAKRALAIDPNNVYGEVTRATALPRRDNWLAAERALRAAIGVHSESADLQFALSNVLDGVGRASEALAALEHAIRLVPPAPSLVFHHIVALWSANRLEETDRAMAEAAALYPTNFAVWFSRFYTLMYSGRAREAIALADDRNTRPRGIPESEVEDVMAVARAIDTRDPAQVAAVRQIEFAKAHQGTGHAENSVQFDCALGKVDDAFTIANAYYFSRGFTVPDVRFTVAQGSYSPMAQRPTGFLFNPATAPMRGDRRFDALTRDLGLERYWRESGSQPDYRA